MAARRPSRDELMRAVREANEAVEAENRDGQARLAGIVEKRRAALLAAYGGGVSWKDIAADLGVSHPRVMAMKRDREIQSQASRK